MHIHASNVASLLAMLIGFLFHSLVLWNIMKKYQGLYQGSFLAPLLYILYTKVANFCNYVLYCLMPMTPKVFFNSSSKCFDRSDNKHLGDGFFTSSSKCCCYYIRMNNAFLLASSQEAKVKSDAQIEYVRLILLSLFKISKLAVSCLIFTMTYFGTCLSMCYLHENGSTY